PAFFATYDTGDAPVEGIPACLCGRAPRRPAALLDAGNLDANGKLDIFGYTRRFIEEHYYSKSRRCRDCVHDLTCEGVHINYIRPHGYAPLLPIVDEEMDAELDSAHAAG